MRKVTAVLAGAAAAGAAVLAARKAYPAARSAWLARRLLASLHRLYHPEHEIGSLYAAILATFPRGDTARISAYAIGQLAPVNGDDSGAAMEAWAARVVAYALAQDPS